MAEFPALPLFTDAYIADTRHLSTLQHGAYLLLLMTAWRTHDCALPDDERFLSRCAGLDLRTWRANRGAIMNFWYLNGEQKWCQARLLDERNYVDQLINKKSHGGKTSALKRKESRLRLLGGLHPTPEQLPTPTPISKRVRTKKLPIGSQKKITIQEVSVEMITDWAKENIKARIDLNRELLKFKNHEWKKKIPTDGVKAFRNWLLKAEDFGQQESLVPLAEAQNWPGKNWK